MKNKFAFPVLFASMVAAVLIVGSVSPVMADSETGEKSYKRHWSISIGTAEGSLQITEDNTKHELKASALPLEEVIIGYSDIHKARLGSAVNDSGNYYLVWKLVSSDYDEESDTKIRTIYVLDAGTGEQLTEPITKEGGCGYKDKSETTKTSGEKA